MRKGERTLMTGPSGSGKSTLFRAIAGIWPFGAGSIAIPARATLMMLPQRPYFPVGSLHGRSSIPAKEGTFTTAKSAGARSGGIAEARVAARRKWRTGTGRCRSASNSASGSRARCCTRRSICSSTKQRPRSMNLRRRRCIACSGEIAGNHHRLDRPSLDARRLPPAQCQARPRRRSNSCAGGPVKRESE